MFILGLFALVLGPLLEASKVCVELISYVDSLIVRFMGPTWGPFGADRTRVGPMLAPWTLLSGLAFESAQKPDFGALPLELWSRRRYENMCVILVYKFVCWSHFENVISKMSRRPSRPQCVNNDIRDNMHHTRDVHFTSYLCIFCCNTFALGWICFARKAEVLKWQLVFICNKSFVRPAVIWGYAYSAGFTNAGAPSGLSPTSGRTDFQRCYMFPGFVLLNIKCNIC